MSQEDVVGIAKTILVPVANPDTAPQLLRLAAALIHNEHSKIIALMISTGDVEDNARFYAEIEAIVTELRDETSCDLQFQSHNSISVSRGIVDIAQNEGADLLILGIQRPVHGQVALGTVVENVLAIAPCDVLVYRAGTKTDFERIVIPVDGSADAKVACLIGVRLAEHYQVKAEAMYVQPSYRSRWEGLGRIEQSLEDVPASQSVVRTLVTAHDPADGIMARVTAADLVVVGYSERPNFERWLTGDFSRRIFNQTQAQVVLASHASSGIALADNIGRFFNRFSLRLTPIERDDIHRQVYDETAVNLDFMSLILISATLAALGLLLDSAAVIIGAMLVAPFMQPCIALAVGLATAHLRLIWRSLLALALGIPLALLVAAVVANFVPGHASTGEMLARTYPTLLDAAVALASGVMGAYATARKDIPSALAGVAIAAALMPPLCTFGLQAVFGRPELALGAGLLFLMNIVFISLAASGIFLWAGMRPESDKRGARERYLTLGIVAVLVVVVMAIFGNAVQITRRQEVIDRTLQQIFAPAEVRSVQIVNSPILKVNATVQSGEKIDSARVRGAELALAEAIQQPVQLEVVVLPLVTASDQP